jgi:hypothetical protein
MTTGGMTTGEMTTGEMTTLALLPPAGCVTISLTKTVSDPAAGRQVGAPPPRAAPAPCSPARDRNDEMTAFRIVSPRFSQG